MSDPQMEKLRKQFTVSTQAEVAAFFELSLDTIRNWASKGMPGKRGKYNLIQIMRWALSVGPWKSDYYVKSVLASSIEEAGEGD